MKNPSHYALITGATSGIGYELALLFAKQNYNLIIVSRDLDEMQEKAVEFKDFGIDVRTIQADLFDPKSAFFVCENTEEMGISVEVLINDAGQGLYGEFKDTDILRELDIVNLNISSLIILTKYFIKKMILNKNGKILNVASVASKAPGPWQSVYHGTKAFVLSFTEGIRQEVKDHNVTVSALLPGFTNTDFIRKADMEKSKIFQDKDAMADPKKVAKDGFEALMSNEDKVISGLKNKINIALGNLTPDDVLAKQMEKKQRPAEEG
ncbi:SDR family NAD(P)-dependent oxidoreductase [Algoriphagus vanfongensis]|uniref:SDR family NAD(P)-dependent oxidoreductase n=1 Tax=Algoriphagus vanfongensis TaxID=426371 RepID=UPI0003F78D8B|nr:SDR family oxidoreductase [Algoriphagus vanfongensis]